MHAKMCDLPVFDAPLMNVSVGPKSICAGVLPCAYDPELADASPSHPRSRNRPVRSR